MEAPIFFKSQMEVISLNVKPSILLPGIEGWNLLFTIQEHLAGVILKSFLRVKFHANQPTCQDCKPGTPFKDDSSGISLWSGCGVN
jgi:hypothetical protein